MKRKKTIHQDLAAIAVACTLIAGAMGPLAYAAESKTALKAPVNLNQASVEELSKLKGIGPKTAERIIACRREHGPFQTADQLVQIEGIGNAKFERMKDQITV